MLPDQAAAALIRPTIVSEMYTSTLIFMLDFIREHMVKTAMEMRIRHRVGVERASARKQSAKARSEGTSDRQINPSLGGDHRDQPGVGVPPVGVPKEFDAPRDGIPDEPHRIVERRPVLEVILDPPR